MKKKILVTGKNGRFVKILKEKNKNLNLHFCSKEQLDILSLKSIERAFIKFKPNILLHCAGLSRPMEIHEKYISKSIDLNIIGTCNIVKACKKKNIKIIYFSTSYVYPGTKGNYREIDGVRPWNNYGWSKLGGECAVQMYKNSLIIRACMTEKPFLHKSAYINVKSNFIFHNDFIKIFLKLINKKGVFNIGGKTQSIYNFAKMSNKNVRKKFSKGEFPLLQGMNLNKIKKYI